jgi:hypothetical protein
VKNSSLVFLVEKEKWCELRRGTAKSSLSLMFIGVLVWACVPMGLGTQVQGF